jgi:MFS family permease
MPTPFRSIARRARDLSPITLPLLDRETTTLPPSEVHRAMRLGVAEGVCTQIHLSLTFGTLATGLALLLGAGSFALGILAAMPVIGALMQFPAAWWIERTGERRRLSVIGSLGRQLWLIPAILLFLPFFGTARLGLFLLATALGHMLLSMAVNAWTSWMTDLIPAAVRGRYFGARGALMSGAAMIAAYTGAWWIDYGRTYRFESGAYAVVLIVAAVSGGLGTLLLRRQPEPPMSAHPRRRMADLLRLPLQNRGFRAFTGTFVLWQIGLGVAAPFFIAYGLTTLKLPLRTLALMDVVTALTGLLAQQQWGKLADRIGQRRVLAICMVLIVPLPWIWLLARPDRVWPLFFNAIMSGIMWAGFLMTQTNRLMEQAPADGRSAYFAAFSVATGLPFMFASLAAGSLITVIGLDPLTIAGITFHPYLGFFVLSGFLRLGALLFGHKAL